MKISKENLNDIAQSLEAGMKVYLNKDNYAYKEILDMDRMGLYLDEPDEELEEIEENWENYTVISQMESYEAFRVMENFVDEVPDRNLQEQLIKILNRRSPFANFKAEIDESDYRQQWFDFKNQQYIEYVKDHLRNEGIAFED